MTNEKKTYARRIIKSTQLNRVLERLRKHYKAEDEPNHLVIPYILTCAAYLEAKLNDALFEYVMKRYGEIVTSALLSLKLPTKLGVLVQIMTDGRYRIRTDHFVYQRLATLIRVRNRIAHAKSELEEVAVADTDLIDAITANAQWFKMPRQFMSEPDITLGTSKPYSPLEYHEALEKLNKWFFLRCPDKLQRVAMVIDQSKEEKWKPEYSSWTKDLDK